MGEFLAMGGYAAYVWPSYGLTAVILAVLLMVSLRGLKTTEADFWRLKTQADASKNKIKETPNGDEA